MFFFSPLEQFLIYPIVSITLGKLDFSFTNASLFFIIVFAIIGYLGFVVIKPHNECIDLVPTLDLHLLLEKINVELLNMVIEIINHPDGQKFFQLIFSIFIFIFSINAVGLIPYTFTLTSHLSITLTFSLALFIGVVYIAFKTNGLRAFETFLPQGTHYLLAPLLVPIEIISYVFKPISLSIRLFANMMAGHTLLKVIAGFSFILMSSNSLVLFLLHYIPLLILCPLYGLELAVSLIQAYVFSLLICVYLNDSLNIH